MRFFLTRMVLLAMLVGLIVVPADAQFLFLEHPLVGQKATDFDLKDLKANRENFFRISSGKDTILFFWATWCPHCRTQLKKLNSKAEQLKKDGIELVLIDLGEEAATVKGFLEKSNVNFKVLLDEEGMVAEEYRVFGIPTFIFVDKTGVVRNVENYLPDNYKGLFRSEDTRR